MKKNTFKDYKLAIKEHFIIAKERDISGILENPSPAQMRNFCLMICDKGISKYDEEIFRLFFETKEGEDLKKSIDRCNIDKFRSIISFLKGDKDSENNLRVEMASSIIDFKERPYKVFSKNTLGDINEGSDKETQTEELIIKNDITKKNELHKKPGLHFWVEKNKLTVLVLIIISLIGGYSVAKFVFKEKECMQWVIDHYEPVDCQSQNQVDLLKKVIIPQNKELTNFRKIQVCDTTTFFINDKPIVWYCKVGGKPEFFNSIGTGFHPETGSPLRPVSNLIIKKYVLKTN